MLTPMYIRLFIIFFLVINILCLPALVKADLAKSKIAVLDFELCGDPFTTDSLGAMVAEWFVTSLVKDGRFEVVERALLQKLLAEQQLGASGAIDDSSASKIGKILGVKIVITGSVLNVGKRLEINSRIINVEDGTIIAAESIKCPSGADLQMVVKDLTGQIVKNFPLTGYVVKKDEKTVMIDLGKDAGVQQGMEFEVFKEGNVIHHPKTGEALGVERTLRGRIKISQIHGNVAEATILKEEAEGIEYGQLVNSVQEKKKTTPKSTGEDGVKLADSPIFEDSPKQNLNGNVAERKGDSQSRTKHLDRAQSRSSPEPRRQLVASAPGCQELLKTWQLGDSSVMQRYLKECSK